MKIVPRTLAGLVGAAAIGLTTSACGSGPNVPAGEMAAVIPPGSQPMPSKVVVLQHFSFDPSLTSVKAGQTIEWIWRTTGDPMNVTFANFHSATQTTGVYYHTFEKPGTYNYSSTLDYNMMGSIVVTAS
ncbi:MAG: cupredoxin domain-containing protein [Acidimicrobiales bacterium]